MTRSRIPLDHAQIEADQRKMRLEFSIAEIGLSVRTTNCLEEEGILTVKQLLQKKPQELLQIANFGQKTLAEVYAALENLGFYRPGRKPKE